MLLNEEVIFLQAGEPVYNPDTSKNEISETALQELVNATTMSQLRAIRDYGVSDYKLVILRAFQPFPAFREVAIKDEFGNYLRYTKYGHQEMAHTMGNIYTQIVVSTGKSYEVPESGVFILNVSNLNGGDTLG
jgi:hypothetical protein